MGEQPALSGGVRQAARRGPRARARGQVDARLGEGIHARRLEPCGHRRGERVAVRRRAGTGRRSAAGASARARSRRDRAVQLRASLGRPRVDGLAISPWRKAMLRSPGSRTRIPASTAARNAAGRPAVPRRARAARVTGRPQRRRRQRVTRFGRKAPAREHHGEPVGQRLVARLPAKSPRRRTGSRLRARGADPPARVPRGARDRLELLLHIRA